MFSQTVVPITMQMEGWSPKVATNIEATKLFSIKLINMGTFMVQLYNIQTKGTLVGMIARFFIFVIS